MPIFNTDKGIYMLNQTLTKSLLIFLLVIIVSVSIIYIVRTPVRLDVNDVTEINQKHPIIFSSGMGKDAIAPKEYVFQHMRESQ